MKLKTKAWMWKKCECCGKLNLIHKRKAQVLCDSCSLYVKKLKSRNYSLERANADRVQTVQRWRIICNNLKDEIKDLKAELKK